MLYTRYQSQDKKGISIFPSPIGKIDSLSKMSENGISEEEFIVFQQKMNEERQELFAIKETCKELKKGNQEFLELSEKLKNLENDSADSKKRHEESLSTLKEEMQTLRQKIQDLNEQNQKDKELKTKELNDRIETFQQKVQLKEDKISIIGQNVKLFDQRFQKKKQELNEYKEHVKKYQPIIEFLRQSRNYPMYIEDLKMQTNRTKTKYFLLKKEENEKTAKLSGNTKFLSSLEDKLRVRTEELTTANNKMKTSFERIDSAQREIKQTEEAIEAATQRLDTAREENSNYEEKQQKEINEIIDRNESLKEEKEKLEKELQKLSKDFDDEKSDLINERDKWKDAVSDLRKEVTQLKDTGNDPTIPRIDLELRSQISNIQNEKETIKQEISSLKKQLVGKHREIDTIEFQLMNQTLKEQPTQKIQENPDFQTKQLLLEELIVQNVDVQNEIIRMNGEIVRLKEDSKRIRSILKDK